MNPSPEGRVVAMHLNVGHREPLKVVETATFSAGQGIAGDRHATTRVERRGFQVLLIDEETLLALRLSPGDVRENVTTSGIDVASLSSGQLVHLGDRVVLSVSKPAAPCSRMEEVRPGLQRELEGRRGMLASVERGGTVNLGDAVTVLES